MKKCSPKVPIILAAIWFAVCSCVTWFALRSFTSPDIIAYDVKLLAMAAILVFSIVMMAVIRGTSQRSQVRWLAVISKVLLIFYSVVLGLLLLFVVLRFLL